MDLLSDAGFALALVTVLKSKPDECLCVIGLDCSSFVTINAGTHCRTPITPLGDESVAHVRRGNRLASRCCLLILVMTSMNLAWLIEQPRSSNYPRRFGLRMVRLHRQFCKEEYERELKKRQKKKSTANKEMQEQMKMLMAMVRDKPNKDALKTPPPKRKAVSTPEPASDASGTEDLSEQDDDAPTEQACFVNRVIKSKERTNRKSAKSKRGWFTKEAMVKNLGWSSSYAANAIKYCEKKNLVKKDRYNNKLKKYYVEYEEGDEHVDEEEEKAGRKVKFNTLGKKKSRLVPDIQPESSDDANEDDKEADDVKSIRALEEAVEILEKEYEVVEEVRAETSDLQDKNLAEGKSKELLAKVDARIKKTTVARLARSGGRDDCDKSTTQSCVCCQGVGNKLSGRMIVDLVLRITWNKRGASFLWKILGLAPANHVVALAKAEVDNNLGPGALRNFPYMKLSNWVKFLLDSGRLRQLCGIPDVEHMKAVLTEFWTWKDWPMRELYQQMALCEFGACTLV
ncbi:unnamed protein product [Effrenium voratum]|nr:unnamed protein product [Effrenium voratum]